jgi:hypothetical protein
MSAEKIRLGETRDKRLPWKKWDLARPNHVAGLKTKMNASKNPQENYYE